MALMKSAHDPISLIKAKPTHKFLSLLGHSPRYTGESPVPPDVAADAAAPDAPRPTVSDAATVKALRLTGAPLPPNPRGLRLPLRLLGRPRALRPAE